MYICIYTYALDESSGSIDSNWYTNCSNHPHATKTNTLNGPSSKQPAPNAVHWPLKPRVTLDILHQKRSAVSSVWLTLYFQIGQSIFIGIHRQIRQITLFILKAVQILVWSNLRITVDILRVPTFAWCQGMVMVRFCSTFHELQPSRGAASLGSRGNYQGMQLGYHVPIENSGVKSSASGPTAQHGNH